MQEFFPVIFAILLGIMSIKLFSMIGRLRSRPRVSQLATRYPGYAIVTGASAGLGEKVPLFISAFYWD